MVFNPLIPQPNDFLSVSQKGILQNFQQFSRQFGQDHVAIDPEDINRGKHKKIGFAEQTGDPTTGANEVALYTKDNSGQPELYFAPEAAATVKRVTKNSLWVPGLLVEASVIFDARGNIIQENTGEQDEQGNPIKRDLAYNVSSVTVPTQFKDEFIINFTSPISTVNYFWVIGWGVNTITIRGNLFTVCYQPASGAGYSLSVTQNFIKIAGYFVSTTVVAPRDSSFRTSRINLTIYTVG